MSERATEQSPQGRLWWPDTYADERMPEGRATPDAWLCRLNDGAHAYGIPGDRWYAPMLLHEGERVDFMWGDPPVEAVLTIAEDGSFVCAPQLPDGQHIYVVGDADVGADSVGELVTFLKDDVEAEPGDHRIAYQPSSGGVPFHFTAIDGPPRFVRMPDVVCAFSASAPETGNSGGAVSAHLDEKRLWWPAPFRNEGWDLPGRASPDAWLGRNEAGAHAYGPLDPVGDPVSDGDIVRFICADACPISSLTINADRTWSIAPVPPLTATLVLRGEPDFTAETVEQLVAEIGRSIGPGEYEITAAIWSGEIAFRFSAGPVLGSFALIPSEQAA